MPEFEFRTVPKQDTAVINFEVPVEQISEAMGEAFPRLFETVAHAGGAPTGPALARYFSFGGPTISFECAIPLAAPFAGVDDIKPGSVGGCEVAFGVHVGPYDTLAQTWEAMADWIREQGRTPSGPGWESYLTDPSEEPDPAKYVTEVYLPVE